MKTRHLLPLFAGLVLITGSVPRLAAADKAPDNVTLVYQDPDKFTDVLENGQNYTSTYFLDELSKFFLQTASPLLAAGQKLAITVLDVDLAGESRFNQPNQIRIMKEIYYPRMWLKFQLVGADGKVVQEGERHIQDRDFMMRAGLPRSEDPLYYDKQMIRDWLIKEFHKPAK